MKHSLKTLCQSRRTQQLALLALLISLGCLSADAFAEVDPTTTDLLANYKGAVTKNFGQGSVVEYGLYVAEVIGGAVAYMKSKNLLGLISIPVLVIVTYVGFKFVAG